MSRVLCETWIPQMLCTLAKALYFAGIKSNFPDDSA